MTTNSKSITNRLLSCNFDEQNTFLFNDIKKLEADYYALKNKHADLDEAYENMEYELKSTRTILLKQGTTNAGI